MLKLVIIIVGLTIKIRATPLFPNLPNFVQTTNNELCHKHSQIYKQSLDNLTLWAYKMQDASAQSVSGLLNGNVNQMGNWEQCVYTEAPFTTKYCLVSLTANVTTPKVTRDSSSLYYSPYESVLNRIRKIEDITQQSRHAVKIALCIPESCSAENLKNSLNVYLKSVEKNYVNVTYTTNVNEFECITKSNGASFDPLTISFCFSVFLITMLILSSTILDYCNTHPTLINNTFNRFYLCLSAIKNYEFINKADGTYPELKIIYGIKTIATVGVIMGHRIMFSIGTPTMNMNFIEKQYRQVPAAILLQGELLVDTFLLIGGLLLSYLVLVKWEKRSEKIIMIILSRYIRIIPVAASLIFFYATVLIHTGSGPLWNLIISGERENCRNNWWTNILLLNNYVKDNKMCAYQTWYLACEFQLFVLGLLLLLLTKRNRKLGIALLTFFLLLSISIQFILVAIYSGPALFKFTHSNLAEMKEDIHFRMSYIKLNTRATSYIVGMLTGLIYYKLRGSSKTLSKKSSFLLTGGSILIIVCCIATGTIFYNVHYEYNNLESAAYASLHRLFWSLGTAGIMFSATHGHANILKNFLSWSPFITLSKLAYGAYLVHILFQLRDMASTSIPQYVTYFSMIHAALGDTVLSFATSFVLYLGIEIPMLRIFKELFQKF